MGSAPPPATISSLLNQPPSCLYPCLPACLPPSPEMTCISCAGSVGACVPCNGDLPNVLETEEPLEPGATPTPVSPADLDDTVPPFPVGEPLDRALVRPRKLQNGKCDVFGQRERVREKETTMLRW